MTRSKIDLAAGQKILHLHGMSKRFSVFRTDKGELTPEGYLKVPATFTRVGVFNYLDKDGKVRRELRHPDDVFHQDSIRTLQLAPLTRKHPKDFVSVRNIKELQTGHVGDGIKQDGDFLRGLVLITDEKSISDAQKGTVELSCGYHADMVEEQGMWNGIPYDCRQTNIRYNHVAQVEAGRAGSMVRIHLDADDAVQVEQPPKEQEMKKIKIDGKEFDVPPEVAAHVEKQQGEVDGLKSANTDLSKQVETVKAEASTAQEDAAAQKKSSDQLQAKVDSLEGKLKEHKDVKPEDFHKSMKARMKLEKVAEPILGKEFKEDASDLEMMKAVIAKKSPEVKLDEKSEDYIRARFDMIAEDAAVRKDNHEHLNARFSAPRTDADYDVKGARESQTKHESERWKQPLAASKK